jgi:hypothetical protein
VFPTATVPHVAARPNLTYRWGVSSLRPGESRDAERPARRVQPGASTVYQVTGARRSVSEDVSSRTRRYLISMGIRTVCLPLAVFTDGWVRWVFVAGAVLLPYFAVIIANAGRERADPLPTSALLGSRQALGPGRETSETSAQPKMHP